MTFKYLKDDLLAGIVVFFIAIPLCLGIAVASGAPPISGLIAGIVGGIVVGFFSQSQVSVSGPAAGLVVIVLASIEQFGGDMGPFLLALVIAGAIQIVLGILKAGTIAYFIPGSVIKGMLVAIGIIIIMKQLPHFFGYDADYEGDLSFAEHHHVDTEGHNTLTSFLSSFVHVHLGALLIGVFSLISIVLWDKYKRGVLKVVPGALLGVLVGLVGNALFQLLSVEKFIILSEHLVQIPIMQGGEGLSTLIMFPDFSFIGNKHVWLTAVTIGLVASIETLLTIEATDKIDPKKRVTPTNKELLAQGTGNLISGLIGGLPITSVIIRSSTNIASGAKTKLASIVHGILLLLGTLVFTNVLNLIPLASLAAILLVTGWKLASPKVFKNVLKLSFRQWLPFMITVLAIVFTDLLLGIAIGVSCSIILILITNIQKTHYFKREVVGDKTHIKIVLPQEVSYLNKASILITLDRISRKEAGDNMDVILDASDSFYIDYDVLEIIREFVNEKAPAKHIKVLTKGFKDHYGISNNYHLDLSDT